MNENRLREQIRKGKWERTGTDVVRGKGEPEEQCNKLKPAANEEECGIFRMCQR